MSAGGRPRAAVASASVPRAPAATVLALSALLAVDAHAQAADRVGFRATIAPDTVFVGQQVTYALSVRIPADVRQRLRRNPEFVPPEPRAMLAYDLPLARPAADSDQEVHTFRRALFVLTPGRYSIGPARLSYNLPQSASFFSREEERTLRADGVSFVAIDPPVQGRPASWAGAVGRWSASARVEAASARVGDLIVLVLRLEGEGNATMLPRPSLAIPWADVVVQDERVVLDSTPTLLTGVKEFSWLLTPKLAGAQRVPAIEYAYFDPTLRRYTAARAEPLAVQVRAGALVEVPPRYVAAEDTLPLPIRATLAGARRHRVPGGAWWIWAAFLVPLLWATQRFAPTLLTPRRPTAPGRPPTARRRLAEGLRSRTGLDLAEYTTPGALSAALRTEGVTAETARDAEALRDACDASGFGRGAARTDAALLARTEALLSRIESEARRVASAVLVLAVTWLGGCARTPGDDAAMQAFSEGRTAYLGRDFARARDAFLRAARAAPHDPNAWLNVGAAAWQAGDTAAAVFGWQKALRLAPESEVARTRLARVRAPQHRGAARVWPVAPMHVAAAAWLLWMSGWLWATLRARRGLRGRAPWLLVWPGLVLALLAWRLDGALDARDLVVLAEPTPLRSLPALGAEPGSVPIVGEVARVRERRGVWLLLELDGERGGWYPTERTWSLARD